MKNASSSPQVDSVEVRQLKHEVDFLSAERARLMDEAHMLLEALYAIAIKEGGTYHLTEPVDMPPDGSVSVLTDTDTGYTTIEAKDGLTSGKPH